MQHTATPLESSVAVVVHAARRRHRQPATMIQQEMTHGSDDMATGGGRGGWDGRGVVRLEAPTFELGRPPARSVMKQAAPTTLVGAVRCRGAATLPVGVPSPKPRAICSVTGAICQVSGAICRSACAIY